MNVQASKVPPGRLNALVPQSIRRPDGPSVQQPAGMPKYVRFGVRPPKAAAVPGVTFGLDMPSPFTMWHKSRSDSCARNSSIETMPRFTSSSL